MDRAEIARRFERFAALECRGLSPLYERLALGVATDPELLDLAAEAGAGQPPPNLLFGAVHFLLLDGDGHPLANFYPSVSPGAAPSEDAFRSFRAFCLERRGAIRELLASRLVQTNEVQRCACLLPAFALVARRFGDRPLALVEIGASAGLNLLWDRYGYDYGEAGRRGDPRSPVQLVCTPRGERLPPIPRSLPRVASRLGIDLSPLDAQDPDTVRWLRALVWPEENERARLLERALAVARQERPQLVRGDALELLTDILADLPPEVVTCVYHTYTLNQFTSGQREQLSALLAVQAGGRNLYRVSIEGFRRERPLLELVSYAGGTEAAEPLAWCDAHGSSIEWLAEEASARSGRAD